jgi:tetracycline 7-halogenase / FADH2 O2-dependent halogenase
LSVTYDIAVAGSGFAGSLIAMIARRTGRSVVLLERGRHPRAVIGESSTPLSNLLLEALAARYDLRALAPLAKWGSWQRTHPDLACGLKRGFTFYHHVVDVVEDAGSLDRADQLLVAASPRDEIGDTHWYRADFDEFFVSQAQNLGVDYFDEVKLDTFDRQSDSVILKGFRDGREVSYRAKFVIDATGPRGFIYNALGLGEAAFPCYPSTQALYSHFSQVKRLDEALHSAQIPPYPIDDAAVHHVFDGGWIWVLRFNNGITSAGIAATSEAAARLRLEDGASAWDRLLHLIPALREQFSTAKAELPFQHVPRLSFLSAAISGDGWTLLPSAAGFVDPLLSTGFPLTLLGVTRLAEILEDDWGSPRFYPRLRNYAAQTESELAATARLIGSLYANMNNFPLFKSLSLLYFAAASFSETVRRLGKPEMAPSFFLHDHADFGPACREIFELAARARTPQESAELPEKILRAIEPFDVAGLSRRDRNSWYPVEAEDLLQSAWKTGATREQITEMLDRCGFRPQDLPSEQTRLRSRSLIQ